MHVRTSRFFALCLTFALLSFNFPAHSQSQKLYLVELIAIEQTGPDTAGGEIWDKFSVVNSDRHMADSKTMPAAAPVITPDAEGPRWPEYAEMVHLSEALTSLQNNPRFPVLAHMAWIQPITDKRDAIIVPVPAPVLAAPGTPGQDGTGAFPAGSVPPGTEPATGVPGSAPPDAYNAASPGPRLRGTVRIYENQLVFAEVDLQFASLPTTVRVPDGAVLSRPQVYRISEKRRIKLNEVHYFDHPYFGALIRVSRTEDTQPGDRAPADTIGASPR
jgi:Peptidoglycan-binding protein, CsiV